MKTTKNAKNVVDDGDQRLPPAFLMVTTCLCVNRKWDKETKAPSLDVLPRPLISRMDTWPGSFVLFPPRTSDSLTDDQVYLYVFFIFFIYKSIMRVRFSLFFCLNVPFVHSNWFNGWKICHIIYKLQLGTCYFCPLENVSEGTFFLFPFTSFFPGKRTDRTVKSIHPKLVSLLLHLTWRWVHNSSRVRTVLGTHSHTHTHTSHISQHTHSHQLLQYASGVIFFLTLLPFF